MSLDITAYRQIQQLDCAPTSWCDDAEGYPEHFQVYSVDFPERANDLPVHVKWENSVTCHGCFKAEEDMRFQAGSYSGYHWWRDELSKAVYDMLAEHVWKTAVEDLTSIHNTERPNPFYELIEFADNEGTIGPAVSAKLAKDFATFDMFFMKHAEKIGKDHFYYTCRNFKEAFTMAADGGLVKFH